MTTIKIILNQKLLKATDRAARRTKQSRSALVREALRAHLCRFEIQTMEDLDEEGYAKRKQENDESLVWEREAVWPTTAGFPIRRRTLTVKVSNAVLI